MILLWAQDQKVDAASLRVSPNRLQFFVYEMITFNCDVGIDQEVKHVIEGKSPSCSLNRKTTPTGSICTIKHLYSEDSGEYWCGAEGVKTSIISITVTDDSVILESPALPVMERESVTLSCRNKMASSNFTADFYKNGRHINSSSSGTVTIHSVSKSDEGLYKCGISGVGESAESRLAVREPEVPSLPSSKNTSWIVVTVSLTFVLVAVGLYHFGKAYWNRVSEEAGGADEEILRYAVVTIDRRKQGLC
ncbi:Fc receptor-like protein 5 [Melanotaenia boesemani]|uniref:Fc receptor-like protein 5 n=1 Tax=Melanotaenia boesemani TaxID=1250792 RepID=UPI001C05C65D|nr:Fc receptor-like protein 5 [Melanotaenia boesemani]